MYSVEEKYDIINVSLLFSVVKIKKNVFEIKTWKIFQRRCTFKKKFIRPNNRSVEEGDIHTNKC